MKISKKRYNTMKFAVGRVQTLQEDYARLEEKLANTEGELKRLKLSREERLLQIRESAIQSSAHLVEALARIASKEIS